MKLNILILKKYDKFPEIVEVSSSESNSFEMILNYFTKNKITAILRPEEFSPYGLADGRYLVSVKDSNTEFIEYEAKNTGWVRDYVEFYKINRLNIVEADLPPAGDVDSQSTVMTELLARYGKFK